MVVVSFGFATLAQFDAVALGHHALHPEVVGRRGGERLRPFGCYRALIGSKVDVGGAFELSSRLERGWAGDGLALLDLHSARMVCSLECASLLILR